jgi:hypothetical protein
LPTRTLVSSDCSTLAASVRGSGLPAARAVALEHFQAKPALGLDPGVDLGSPSENAISQREIERIPISPERNSL